MSLPAHQSWRETCAGGALQLLTIQIYQYPIEQSIIATIQTLYGFFSICQVHAVRLQII